MAELAVGGRVEIERMQTDLRVQAEPLSWEPPTLQPRHPEPGPACWSALRWPCRRPPPLGLFLRPRSPPWKERDTQKVSEPGGQQRTSQVPEGAWMLRLGRSQRPDRRRQESGGLDGPLQASDVPPVGTLVFRSHPRGIYPCKPTL